MAYTKAYNNKPTWHNGQAPAINDVRLNDLCNATDIIDTRVVELDIARQGVDDSISEITTNLSHLKNGSSNINTIGLEVGSLNSGGSPIADSAKMRMTAMLEIKPNTTYTWSNKNNVELRYVTHFYDATGTQIANSRVFTTTFTTPSDAKYIRTRTEDATIDLTNLWKLEEGSIATPYEPYYKGNVELTSVVNEISSNIGRIDGLLPKHFSMGGSKSFNIKHDGYILLMTDRGGMWFEGVSGRTLSAIQTSANVTVSRTNNTNLKITNGSTAVTTIFYISDGNVEITETT